MKFLIAITLSFYALALSAQTKTIHQRLDSLVLALYNNNQFSGQILIGTLDSVIYNRALGWANKEENQVLTTTTPSRLASISKSITALAILKLHQEGKLSIYDPVYKYIAGFPYPKMTIQHLLTHTSGFPYVNGRFLFGRMLRYSKRTHGELSNQSLRAFILEKKPKLTSNPGEKFRYSNCGYSFLACIIEEVSQMSFEKYLKSHFFDPYGMDSSFVYNHTTFEQHKIAFSYRYSKNSITKVLDYSQAKKNAPLKPYDILYGDKHIFSCVTDLYTLDTAIFKHLIISKDLIKEMTTPAKLTTNKKPKLQYGYGWYKQEHTGADHHTGGIEEYATLNYVDVKENLIVVVLGNKQHNFYGFVGAARRFLSNRPLGDYSPIRNEKRSKKVFEKEFKISYEPIEP